MKLLHTLDGGQVDELLAQYTPDDSDIETNNS